MVVRLSFVVSGINMSVVFCFVPGCSGNYNGKLEFSQ